MDVAQSRLGKFSRTGAGGVRVPATISRTGVQIYDGGVREYRPDSEVFAAASLDSLAAVPVTRGHPSEPVTPENWKQLSLGHVSERAPERARVDGSPHDWVKADVVISDGDTIAASERGDVLEVSAGYSCELDFTPGVTPAGEKYDAVQRNIRFNHLAVLGPGERARAGAEARLRLDQQNNTEENHNVVKIVIDGVEFEKGSDAHIAAVQAADKRKHDAALAAKEAERVALQAKYDAALAERDAAKTDAETAKKDSSPEKVEVLVRDALQLRADAGKLLAADYKFEGKSAHQVRIDAVVAKRGADWVKDKSEAYVQASFDVLVADAAKLPEAQYQGTVPAVKGTKLDASDPALKSDEDLYAAHEARMRKIYTDARSGAVDGKDAN